MDYLGTSYGVLRKEKCTGDPVRRLGNDLLFQQLAEANLEALAQNKVKKIVSICPHCVRTIQEDWKQYGTPPEIEHHSEFLARFLHLLPSVKDQGKIAFTTPAIWAAIATFTNSLEQSRRLRANSSRLRATASAVSAAEPAAAWRFSAKRPASVSATLARRSLLQLARRPLPPPARSAIRCLATRWPRKGEGAPRLLDIAQLAARGLPDRHES